MATTTTNERLIRSGITLGDIPRGSGGATQSAIADLTHTALTGTPDDTLADIATADAALEADIKDLAVKVNAILAALRTAGIISS